MGDVKQYCDQVDDDDRGLVPLLKPLLADMDLEDDWDVASMLHEALHSAYNKGVDQTNARLNALATAGASAQGETGRWVNVEDSLPEPLLSVLVWRVGIGPSVARRRERSRTRASGGWERRDGDPISFVSHWRPLPRSPEQEAALPLPPPPKAEP